MDILCKRCERPIPASDINLDSGFAKCQQCNAVFRFDSQLDDEQSDENDNYALSHLRKRLQKEKRLRKREPEEIDKNVPLPESFSIEHRGDVMEISFRWFTPIALFLLFFCIAWDSFLFVWYSSALGGRGDFLTIVFPLGHVAVGLGLSYYTVALFLNRTYVRASGRELSIRHSPLPWKGARTIPSDDIEQLFCKEEIHRGENGTNHTYEVHAVLRDKKQVKLISGLTSAEQALFIEFQVESHLDIKDAPVRGELS